MSAQSTLDPPNKLTITSQLNRVHVVFLFWKADKDVAIDLFLAGRLSQ